VDWINYLGKVGRPIDRHSVRPVVKVLCGQAPGVGWLHRFLRRHHNKIQYTRTQALDPKRARCFTRAAVTHYFELLQKVIKEHDIPMENMYNMDEKGCQLGGGRKGRRKKYLFARHSKARYRIRDANLELVTVVECVSADGFHLKPYIIFKGERIQKSWVEAEGARDTS
jgi:hypothetical protein